MEIKKYSFRDGFGWRVDPEIAGQHLDRLAHESGGALTPEMVVTDAESDDSPLHKCFD